MKQSEFKQQVMAKAPGTTTRENLGEAIVIYVTSGKMEERHVEECLFYAESLDLMAATDDTLREARHYFPPHAFPAAQGQEVVDAMTMEVESIRQSLFRSERPPYKTYPAAVRWLKKTASALKAPTAKDLKRAQQLETEIIDMTGELARLARCPTSFEIPGPLHLPYVEGGQVKYLKVYRDPPLGPLALESLKLAEKTGLSQAAVIAWILAGLEPILPAARLKIRIRPVGNVFIRKAALEIWDPSADLEPLLKRVREELGPFGLKPRQRLLLDLLRENGDREPGEQRKDYWERFRLEYNQRARRIKGVGPYKNWYAPMTAFDRLDPMFKKDYPELQRRRR